MTWQLNQYRRNLSKPGETKRFLLPWGGVVCQNCDDEGELVHYTSVKEYRDAEKSLWLHLSLMLFRENVSFVHCIHCLLLHLLQRMYQYAVLSSNENGPMKGRFTGPTVYTFQSNGIILP